MTSQAERWLRRFGPLVAGIVSPLVIWWVWGQVDPVAVIHDEASYLLQADIFASGRWTVPTPPIPEFFEQPHVQMEPAMASKYPPGHALLLVPGAALGFHALVPLLLTGITAALLFALAARVANPWVALLAWPIWLFAPMVLRFQPSYLSELTTTPLVLGSWWALLSWRETRRRKWLIVLALCLGWAAITRPLTALVFALPVAIVVLRDVRRERRWRDLAAAFAVGTAVVAVLPLWSAQTTGSWRVSPIEKYRLDYFPFDKIGFDADTTPPRRLASMSRVQSETYWYFLTARKQQSFSALPITAWQRMMALLEGMFQGWRLPLLVAAIVSVFRPVPPVRLAVASAALLFAAHLPYAHWPGWTVYYLEAAPVAAMLAALGVWRIAARAPRVSPATVTAALAGAVVLLGVFQARLARTRQLSSPASRLQREMAARLPTLPAPAILFVRYSSRLVFNPDLVRNSAHPDREPVWVVHDLGPRNEELRRLAPDRTSHALDLDQLVQRTPAP